MNAQFDATIESDTQTATELTVAFDSRHLTERGTDVALYDYADLNEQVLGNRSLICCPATARIDCLDRFRERFEVLLYHSIAGLERGLDGVDVYYRQVAGRRDATWPLPQRAGLRTAVHAVFEADDAHGDVYAAISDFVAARHAATAKRPPVVPYVVRPMPAADVDVRAILGIPPTAIVFGRHGGLETFDLDFAREAVREAVRARDDLWFLFVNTLPFDAHPRVLFLDKIVEPAFKRSFIEACDAMLHARAMGESFGLACAEFSICNKPVVTWFASRDRYHIDVLRERGIYYCDKGDLLRILLSFAPRAGDYDAYSQRFDPLTIMRIFDSVFLEPARRAKQNELRYLDGALASPLGAALTASVNVQGVPDGGSASVLAYQF